MALTETVTDIIVARAQHTDRLSQMVVWSVAGHAIVIALLMLWPNQSGQEAPKIIMTVSLGGAPGPKTGGLTQIGGQTVQAPSPQEAPKPVEAPPAPKTPAMTLPDPKVKPKPQPKVTQAPPDATANKANTGAEPRVGNARVRGEGFGSGLSSAGGSGGPVQLDVSDFCCPEYIDQMRVFIQQRWEQNQGIVGSTGVKFTIHRNGAIQSPQIEKPSGFDALDLAALRALQRTTLPPLPAAFPNPTLTVHMRFDYSR
jgi:periplasmic protein TonB